MNIALDAFAHLTANMVFHFEMLRRNIKKKCFLYFASTGKEQLQSDAVLLTKPNFSFCVVISRPRRCHPI